MAAPLWHEGWGILLSCAALGGIKAGRLLPPALGPPPGAHRSTGKERPAGAGLDSLRVDAGFAV